MHSIMMPIIILNLFHLHQPKYWDRAANRHFFSLRGFATLTGLSVFPRHSIRSGRKLTISNSALSLKQSYQNCHQLLAVRHPGRKLLSTPLDGDLKSRLFWIGIIITFKLQEEPFEITIVTRSIEEGEEG